MTSASVTLVAINLVIWVCVTTSCDFKFLPNEKLQPGQEEVLAILEDAVYLKFIVAYMHAT